MLKLHIFLFKWKFKDNKQKYDLPKKRQKILCKYQCCGNYTIQWICFYSFDNEKMVFSRQIYRRYRLERNCTSREVKESE